jgi:DNA-binding beta-propeller fold protein YncE
VLTLPLELDVRASEGKDFVSQRLAIGARDVAWDAVGGKLYALTVTTGGNALVEVDPQSGTVLRSVSMATEPRRLTLSPNGQYAYVTFEPSPLVQRYRLADLAHDVDIALPGFAIARELAVAPGAPGTFAAVLDDAGQPLRVAIFDGATPRAQTFAGLNNGGVYNDLGFVWSSDATRLYVAQYRTPGVISFDVSAAGLTQAAFTGIAGFVPPIRGAGPRIYSTSGQLFDIATLTAQPAQAISVAGCCANVLEVDAAQGRLFLNVADGIERRSLDGNGRLAIATLPANSAANGSTVRWGNDGLALITSDGTLVILSGSFVKP